MLRTMSLIITICILLSSLGLFGYAKEPTIKTGYLPLIKCDPTNKVPFEPKEDNYISANKFYGMPSEADKPYLFYDTLNENEKHIYNKIYSDINKPDFNGESVFGDTTTRYTEKELYRAVTAMVEDHPIIFWIDGVVYSYYNNPNGKFPFMAVLENKKYGTFAEAKQYMAQLEQEVNKFPVKGISRYEKIKSINDKLCTDIDYVLNAPHAHEPYGALIDHEAVCEGYAEAFKLICDREKIPCITVVGYGYGNHNGKITGEGHKWNYVKMEDGLWYLIDVTWNDQTNGGSTGYYYDYFLLGGEQWSVHFGTERYTDKQMHQPTGRMFGEYAITYPPRADFSYGMGIISPNQKDYSINETKSIVYLGKDHKNVQELFVENTNCYYDLAYKNYTGITGNSFSFTTKYSQIKSKEYTAVLRGDINGDNRLDEEDIVLLTKIVSGDHVVKEGTPLFNAADINQDGAVDGFDAIMANEYLNGRYKFN